MTEGRWDLVGKWGLEDLVDLVDRVGLADQEGQEDLPALVALWAQVVRWEPIQMEWDQAGQDLVHVDLVQEDQEDLTTWDKE